MSANKAQADAAYLKAAEIGGVVAKGMAVTYRANPKNPIDFFARWLLSQSAVRKNERSAEECLQRKQDLKNAHKLQIEEKEKEAMEREQLLRKKEERVEAFRASVRESNDLADQLQSLVDHLQDLTEATAAYVGKVVQPMKAIKEDSNDNAHLDHESKPQVQFLHATRAHQFMVDKILKQDQGITFGLMAPEPKPEEGEEAPEGEEAKPKPAQPAEKLPRFIMVEEVVREPKMHFYQVPRLGSYLAIKMEYESCLFEGAFDAAVLDFQEVAHRIVEQEREKKEYEEQQNEARQEREEAGEAFVAEPREWPEIAHAPFKTKTVTYVVCLNTMGQDRRFSEEQRLTALRCVQEYRDRWEALEKENLESDVRAKLERAEYHHTYKELHEALDASELEKQVEEAILSAQSEEGGEPLSEQERTLISLKEKFRALTQTFYSPEASLTSKVKADKKDPFSGGGFDGTGMPGEDKSNSGQYVPLAPEQWQEKILDFRHLYVMKYPRVLQCLFYLLRYKERDELCERGTNRLQWKKAKEFLVPDLFEKLGEHWPPGPKEETYREYQKLQFIQHSLEAYSEEAVEDYSVALGKLLRWIQLAIELRVEDVKQRRAEKRQLRSEREDAIAKENERMARRNEAFKEAKAIFDERVTAELQARKEAGEEEEEEEDERPEFDAEDWYANYDDENPPVDIPDAVEDDIDNDFNIKIEESQQE